MLANKCILASKHINLCYCCYKRIHVLTRIYGTLKHVQQRGHNLAKCFVLQKVDQVLTVQQRLMFFRSCLPKKWKFLKHYRKLTVRRGYMETLQRNPWYKNIFNYQYWKLEVWTNLKFKLWGGDHYDRSTVINAYVVQPSKVMCALIEYTTCM